MAGHVYRATSRNRLLIPVIIIMYATKEVVLDLVLRIFNVGLIGTRRRRRYYGGGPSRCDSQLLNKRNKMSVKME